MTAPNTSTESALPDLDTMDPMERTIQSTIRESADIVAADEPITGRPRDAQGKFVAVAEGQTAPAGEWNTIPDAHTGDTPDDTAAAPPVIPEGHVALPPLAPEKVQGFKVLDTEGEIVPPDLKFEVNFRKGTNGESETRTLDVPQLVNYARMGVYNHEREQQAVQVRHDNLQLQQRVSAAEQAVSAREQHVDRLLSDPDYLMAHLEQHQRNNTPEARAQREREQVETQRHQLEYERAADTNLRYLDTQVAPALDTIALSLASVTKDELASRLAYLIEPFKVQTRFGTILNPNAFQQIERAIVSDLVPWAQQLHEDREARKPKPAAVPAPDPTAAKAQARAQQVRRVATAALRPAGGNGQLQAPPVNQKPPTSNRDMEDFVVGRSLAGSGARTG